MSNVGVEMQQFVQQQSITGASHDFRSGGCNAKNLPIKELNCLIFTAENGINFAQNHEAHLCGNPSRRRCLGL